MALLAHLESAPQSGERRASARRRLRLEARAADEAGPDVVIHDLSETGMLLETPASLAVNEAIDLSLPEAGTARATIIWCSGRFFGCRFDKPISTAAVSAALLRGTAVRSEEDRARALYNALAELRSLAGVIEEITDRVDAAIAELSKGKRGPKPRG